MKMVKHRIPIQKAAEFMTSSCMYLCRTNTILPILSVTLSTQQNVYSIFDVNRFYRL